MWSSCSNMYLQFSPCFHFIIVIALQVALSSACLKYVPDMDANDHILLQWEKANKARNRKFVNECSCGISNSQSGSTNSWDALVRVVDKSKNVERFCGGTLINSLFVLTAYSCLVKDNINAFDIWGPNPLKMDPSDITVWLNIQSNPFDIGIGANVQYPIQEVIADTVYIVSKIQNGPVTNNVILLKLKKEIDFKDANSPKPICIFPSPKNPSHFKWNVTGWVSSQSGDICGDPFALSGSEKTKEADANLKCFENNKLIDLYDLQTCRKNSKAEVADDQLCVSNLQVNKLKNDGWPLVISTTSGAIIQLGVSSWDDSEYQTGNQASAHRFFTSVTHSLPFINYYSSEMGASWCKEPESAEISEKQPRSSGSQDTVNLQWEGFSSAQRILRKDACVCGEHEAATGRIVGGTDAIPHEFKWQVLLKIRGYFSSKSTKATSTCGGSLINDRMILTAAHCVVQDPLVQENNPFPGVEPSDIKAYLGAHVKDQDGRVVKVKAVYFHPLYIPGTKERPTVFDWDVALLQLEDPLPFNHETEMPVCIARSEEISTLEPVGQMGWVTGWGLINPDTYTSATTLQKIELMIQPLEYCSKIIPVSGGKPRNRVLCAGYLTKWSDSAAGDSGGPMSIIPEKYAKPGMHKFLQVGIVSYGHDVGSKTAGFYTDVRKVLSFIDFMSANAEAEWCPITRD